MGVPNPSVMFSAVGYKAIDYSYEASAKHRLMMNLLMLPVPVQLDISSYPHTGKLREKAYRTPWVQGCLHSTSEMDENAPLLDDLKAYLHSAKYLERFEVGVNELGSDIVPSSNSESQRCLESQEALWLLEGGEQPAEQNGWIEKFSMAETHSVQFSYQDLFLTEEIIMSDHHMSHLPSLLTLVKRFKTLPVSDPLCLGRAGSLFSELFRRCAPFETSSGTPSSGLSTPSVIEEFRKEPLSETECLVLPTVIEMGVAQERDHIKAMTKLREALSVNPEAAEEEITVLESLSNSELNVPECEKLSPDLSSVLSVTLSSPVPFRSYVEFETDLLLSLPSPPVQPEHMLPTTNQLSARSEPLSPAAITRRLLTEAERVSMERAVWMTEKHQQCVAGLLLAEPWISEPSVRQHSMPELLSVLRAERGNADVQNVTLITEVHSDPAFRLTEALTEESTQKRTQVDTTETFTQISITQTDVELHEESMQSREVQSAFSSLVRQGKSVKFIIQENDSLKRSMPCKNGSALSKSNPASSTPSALSPSINTGNTERLYGLYESMAKNLELLKSAAGSHFARGAENRPEKMPYRTTAKYNRSAGGAHSTEGFSEKCVQNPATRSDSTDAQTFACTENFNTDLQDSGPRTSHINISYPSKNTLISTPPNHSTKPTYSNHFSENTIMGDHSVSCTRPSLISALDSSSTESKSYNSRPETYSNPHSVPSSSKPVRNGGFHQEDTSPAALSHSHLNIVTSLLSESKNTFIKEFSSDNSGNTCQINNPSGSIMQCETYQPASANLITSKNALGKSAQTPRAHTSTPRHSIPPTPSAKDLRRGGRRTDRELETTPSDAGGAERVSAMSEPDNPEHMDPLSSFMMLRSFLKSPVVQKSEQTPQRSTVSVREDAPTSKDKSTADMRMTVTHSPSETRASVPAQEKAVSRTIRVPATDSDRAAYQELHLLALSILNRVEGSNTLNIRDFSSLTPDHTRFSLKQQEKLISTGQGKESVYHDVALLHILVTVRELLLRCDLNTATDYLTQACSSSTVSSVLELLRKFQVLQYMSRRRPDTQPRVQQLQEQINIWLQRNTSKKVLVVAAQERVRTELVTALSQIPGNSVPAVLTEQDSKLESRQLANSRCAVVCVQQIQSWFSWRFFSAVFEFECLGQSAVRNICTQNNISYTSFITAAPHTDSWLEFSPLDRVPFLLFITEGLLKRSHLLQLLESTYNMTLLERSHPPSMRSLGSTELYDIITVDENTAVLLQDLAELEQERASERVVIRMSALSLQFRRCWVLLHFTEHHRALVCASVLTHLMLIYSAMVLFGHKSGGLDVKVLLLCDVADIAKCVYQICIHTLLTSERDVCEWLNRDGFSVLPTQEEQVLLCFPCVNSVVAQLMLSRAPSLQWLLEASHTQLEEMFPEVTPTVFKLFSDITAQQRLSASMSEPNLTHAQSGLSWILNTDEVQSQTHSFLTQHTGSTAGGCGSSVQCQSWEPGDKQDGSYTDKPWTPGASSLLNSDPAFTHTPHTPFSQTLSVIDDVGVYYQPSPTLTQHSAELKSGGNRAQLTHRVSERKRPAEGTINPVVRESHCKRGRLQCERVPGRSDGQTRLSFF